MDSMVRGAAERISDPGRVFVIAEAGVNHNGSVALAKKLIDAAAEAGADAVKFQTFRAEAMISKHAPKAAYQKTNISASESQLQMLKRLELDADTHIELISYSRQKNIRFLSSPFDLESIDLLNRLGIEIFKIPSCDISNLPYLRKIGGLKRKIIFSTGMADLEVIKNALEILLQAGTKRENVAILHCTTEYPTPFETVNLRAMRTIAIAFPGIRVGYSDHTLGIEVPVAAVALGASIIEKHITIDRSLEGPDHKISLEPSELKWMVQSIRNIERALGNGSKKPGPGERDNMPVALKSIVAASHIKKGDIFTADNLAVKRPGTGISPMRWDEIIGTRAKKNFDIDDLIEK